MKNMMNIIVLFLMIFLFNKFGGIWSNVHYVKSIINIIDMSSRSDTITIRKQSRSANAIFLIVHLFLRAFL